MNEVHKMMRALCARGIVSASNDNGKCKRKIVELGLTIPEGKNDCLLYGVERQEAMHIFAYFRDPARHGADLGFVGLKFDFAKYRRNPLAPDCGVREACVLFANAAAELSGFNVAKCTWDVRSPFRN